mgnify:CR=1 FL=1
MIGRKSKTIITLIIILMMTVSMIPVFSTTAEAASTTVYVNANTGNDSTGDGSSSNPYKTFTKGYSMAASGDTLDLTGTFTWTDADETGDSAETADTTTQSTNGFTIDKNMTIQGHGVGTTIIQAGTSLSDSSSRVFFVNGADATFNNLELRYGLTTYAGGAIRIAGGGNVTIDSCYIHDNEGDMCGGGIEVAYATSVTITNTTISNNASPHDGGGGGIRMASNGTLILTNSTICNNTIADWAGGTGNRIGAGIYLAEGYSFTAYVTNCTITGNTTDDIYGAGVCQDSGTAYLKNNLIANNTSNEPSVNDYEFYGGTLNDNGGNIVEFYSNTGSGTGGLTSIVSGDQSNLFGTGVSATPVLALNDTLNGVPTIALGAGSVAINGGGSGSNGSVSVPNADQRGFARDALYDVGAYENGATGDAAPVASSVQISGTAKYGQTVTGSYSYSDADSDPEGESTFKWYRADNASGLNKTEISGAVATSYTLTAADIGKYIAFEVTPVAQSGTSSGTAVQSSYTAIVQKADCATPTGVTPVLSSKTDATVALTSVAGYEYLRVADGAAASGTWQDSNVFSGLTPGTAYDFYQRVKETDTHKASAISAKLDATTYTKPVVTSVSVPANGTYKAGDDLEFYVHFDEKLTITGAPRIALTIGSNTVYATYYGYVAGLETFIFRYTVEAGLLDSDGIAVGALSLNGGTIRSFSNGVDADLTLNNVNSTTGVLVDTIAPTVTSVSVPANDTYITGQNLDFAINFSENVTVDSSGGTPRFALTIGSDTVYADYFSGSGSSAIVFRHTIESGLTDSDGIAVGALSLNGGTMKDAAGNDANLTLNSVGSTTGVLVDAVAPTVSSVNKPSDGTYTTGDNLDFTVNFDEGVTVNTGSGTPYLTLTVGSSTVHAVYMSGSGTSALVFRYTVVSGNKDGDGIELASNITLNGGTMKDAAGNNTDLAFTGSTLTGVIVKDAQTITFANPGAQNFGTSLTLTATASSTLPVTFTSDTPEVCTVSGNTVTFLKAGDATISVDQAGNDEYLPATTVSQTFRVNAVVPGAPIIGMATAGNGQATISFTAPASNGGTAITGYTATSSPGGITGTGAGSPITVTGLTNGTTYNFTVTATNSAGTSTASSASNGVTPKAVQAITFNNPGAQDFGTSPTLTATASSGLDVTFTSDTPDVCTVTSAGVLTFLKAGTATITAHQAGNSEYLSAAMVTQSFAVNAVLPGAPTDVTAVAGNTTATISFTAPASNGGAAITGYTVTSGPGGITATGASSPITLTGLTNGTAYTFTVAATNSAGTGTASTTSNSVVPRAPQTITFANPGSQDFGTSPTLTATSSSGLPVTFKSDTPDVCTVTSAGVLTFLKTGTATITAHQAGNSEYLSAAIVSRSFTVNAVVPSAPTIGTVTAGNGQATVSFTPPASNGGADITGYKVTSSPGGFTASGTGSPITVTGLANGVAYTFTVTATNTAGTGAASPASSSVTPIAAATPTPTPAPTATPTPTPAPSATPAPTATPSATLKPTVKPTATPTATPLPSATPAPTVTPTPAPTATSTPTVTPTVTPSQTAGANTRTITGTLLDSNGNPMAGYVVELHSDPITTITDANGRYTFRDVEYTKHEMIVKTPKGEEIAAFELSFSQGEEFDTDVTEKGVNVTFTNSTATVDIEVAVAADQSGATISHVQAVENPQTDDTSGGIGTVLLWIGGGIFAAAIIAALVIILLRKRRKGTQI